EIKSQADVVPADYICSRTSKGRSDWDISLPKFDCLCPVLVKTNYLTIDGETVLEI
ncbi:3927_t:CDS:2, partial [Gigaspora rosea]